MTHDRPPSSPRREMNRPGESGDSGCCLADLDESGVLTVIGGLKPGGRDVAAGLVEPLAAEPVDAVQGASSTCSAVRQDPAGLISSVLYNPIADSARALSRVVKCS